MGLEVASLYPYPSTFRLIDHEKGIVCFCSSVCLSVHLIGLITLHGLEMNKSILLNIH